MSKGNIAAAVLEGSGLGAVLRRVPAWRGLLIVNHHRVGDGTGWTTGRDVWSATAEQLDAQMAFLSRNFELVGPDELCDAVGGLRGRRVAVTFDDGYRECHDVALPILRSHGVRAVFFLTTGFIDGTRGAWWDEITWMVSRSGRPSIPADGWLPAPVPIDGPRRDPGILRLHAYYKTLDGDRAEGFLDYLAGVTGSGRRGPASTREEWLSWDMVREMRQAGMGFGGHSVNHPVLARQSPERQLAEIGGSLGRIEQELQERPRLFSYPEGTRGAFDATTKAALRECEVRLAFTNHGGILGERPSDPYEVPRIGMDRTMPATRFRAITALPRHLARR